MSARRHAIAIAILVAGGAAHATSARPGVAATSVTTAERAKLEAAIERAKREQPEVFARVRALRGIDPENYRKSRARRPEATRELVSLGAPALWPMVEILIDGYPSARALSGDERHALELGLLEAVGRLRDARTYPVLMRALGESDEPAAAARALGRLCGAGDEGTAAERILIGRASPSDALHESAIEGLAWCHSDQAALRLESLIEAPSAQPADAKHAAEALGVLASSWGWAGGDRATFAKVSKVAAHTLVRAAATGAIAPEELTASARLVDAAALRAELATFRASADAAAKARLDRFEAGAALH